MPSFLQFAIVTTINKIRLNNQITAPELMIIDNEGKSLGVMTKEAALKLAQDQRLDLIEIAPTAKPPVARIMSFDKYRYLQEKKLKKQRAQQKTQEMKQVQISVREANHDLQIKAERVNKFLSEGHAVEILLTLRGREKAHRDFAREKLADFMKRINPEHKVAMPPRSGMRGIITQVVKN